jgi:hypothetical protein
LQESISDKSVAEQNSVDLCWDLLMDSSFDKLRAAIYSTVDERKRFRQLVVNLSWLLISWTRISRYFEQPLGEGLLR